MAPLRAMVAPAQASRDRNVGGLTQVNARPASCGTMPGPPARALRHDAAETAAWISQTTSRFVIAVFDEWPDLHAALEDLGVHGIAPRGAVLFARDDGPDGAVIARQRSRSPSSSPRPRSCRSCPRNSKCAAPRVRSPTSWRRDPQRGVRGLAGGAQRLGEPGARRRAAGAHRQRPARARGSSLRNPRTWTLSAAGWCRRARTWWACAAWLRARERRDIPTRPDHRHRITAR